jgi:hypothetical protein
MHPELLVFRDHRVDAVEQTLVGVFPASTDASPSGGQGNSASIRRDKRFINPRTFGRCAGAENGSIP